MNHGNGHFDDASDSVAALRLALGGRAAGLWRVDGNHLIQRAFAASPRLPADVAQGFAEATQSVPLDRHDLGIVRAAIEGQVTVSHADQLPEDAGSGLWLRAFGASRSVAIPLADGDGRVAAVFSIALPDPSPSDEWVIELVRDQGPALAP
jgi:hypothetical protein